ncbi:UNVERIFIED_CONTAM: hypothetical protein BEN50_11390 [Euhalothece sp. KZN 001]
MQTIIDSNSQGVFYHRKLAQVESLKKYRNRITISLLWGQLEYWFFKCGGNPFYKFVSPSQNDVYKEGDSWCEELVISEKEFRNASRPLITRYKTKSQFDKAEDKFKGLPYCCYTDRRTGKTWYFRNHEILDPFFEALVSETGNLRHNKEATEDLLGLTKVEQEKILSQTQGQSYTSNSGSHVPAQTESAHIPERKADLYTEITQENTQETTQNIESNEKKNNSENKEEFIDAEIMDSSTEQLALLPDLDSNSSELVKSSKNLSREKNKEIKEMINPVIEIYNSAKPDCWVRKNLIDLEGHFKQGTSRYTLFQCCKRLVEDEGYQNLLEAVQCALEGAKHHKFYAGCQGFRLEWMLRPKNFNPLVEAGKARLQKKWNAEAVQSGKPVVESSSKQEKEIKLWVTYLTKIDPNCQELPPESIREEVFARIS